MTILVCPLSKVESMIALHRPGRVVSLLDPESTFPEFVAAWDPLAPLLIHCRAGIGRSTAAADLADREMGRNGRMSAAIAATGRGLAWHGADEGEPFQLSLSGAGARRAP